MRLCWDSSSVEPDITRNKKVIATLKNGVFQAKLTGLAYNTSYHVRAYAVNGKGVGYSAYVIIKTGSSAKATIVNMAAGNPSPSTLMYPQRFLPMEEPKLQNVGLYIVQKEHRAWKNAKREL